jgi:hypothetical protein
MPKQILFDEQARLAMQRGVDKLANAVKVTLGPRGKTVVLDRSYGAPTITKDGVTVAKEIELEDKFENLGAELVKEVASKTNDVAGDGTTTATVLAQSMIREGLRALGSGVNAGDIKRGTAVPDANLGMDHVGLPEQMLWQMYDKLVVARLVRTGYPALDARERVNKKDPVAREALLAETKERPVLINRAPTLHRWSIVAAHPVPVQGKTIRVNPFIEKGMNLDYDGDTLQVHVPVTQDAIEEAKHMTLSNMLLSDQTRRKLMAFPQHEAIIGFTHASKAGTPTGPAKKFKTEEEAIAAWRKGALQLTDHIEIEDKSAVKKAAWVSDAEVLAALQEGREATPDLLATTLCWLESDDA